MLHATEDWGTAALVDKVIKNKLAFLLRGDKKNHTLFHLVGEQSMVGAKPRWPYSMRCENEAYNHFPDAWNPDPEPLL